MVTIGCWWLISHMASCALSTHPSTTTLSCCQLNCLLSPDFLSCYHHNYHGRWKLPTIIRNYGSPGGPGHKDINNRHIIWWFQHFYWYSNSQLCVCAHCRWFAATVTLTFSTAAWWWVSCVPVKQCFTALIDQQRNECEKLPCTFLTPLTSHSHWGCTIHCMLCHHLHFQHSSLITVCVRPSNEKELIHFLQCDVFFSCFDAEEKTAQF